MERVKFIEHEGRRILYLDFSDPSGIEEVSEVIAEAKTIISAEPEGSVLMISDFTGGLHLLHDASGMLKDFLHHNEPYVKAGAVLGVSGFMKIAYTAALRASGRGNLKLFDDTDDAKDWLIAQ